MGSCLTSIFHVSSGVLVLETLIKFQRMEKRTVVCGKKSIHDVPHPTANIYIIC